jgi:hypothetical protein
MMRVPLSFRVSRPVVKQWIVCGAAGLLLATAAPLAYSAPFASALPGIELSEMTGDPVAARGPFDLPYAVQTTPTLRSFTDLREFLPVTDHPGGVLGVTAENLSTPLKVGETRTVTFRFKGADGPFVAGAVLLEPQPVRDATFFSSKRILADRDRATFAAFAEAVPTDTPDAVSWKLTGAYEGTVVIVALAANRQGGFVWKSFTVNVGEDAAPTVTVDEPTGDFTLRPGEAALWTGMTKSLAARVPSFDYAVISAYGAPVGMNYANSTVKLTALGAGSALLVGCVGDGAKSRAFARRVYVTGDADPMIRIRSLASNVVTADGGPETVTVFGDTLGQAAQAFIVGENETEPRAVAFRAKTDTVGRFTFTPDAPGNYTFWLADAAGNTLTAPQRIRAVGVQVTGIARVHRTSDKQTFALFVRGQGFGNYPTLIVDGQEVAGAVKRSLHNQVNQRVLFRLPASVMKKSAVTVQVMNPQGYLSETFLLPLGEDR